jgi:hypothetical protein
MDGPSVFREALGLTAQASNAEWINIKETVHKILNRRNLVGQTPSSIKEIATKKAMGEQLETVHQATFSSLGPACRRRDLVQRIFAYEMTKLRRSERHKQGKAPSQPTTPNQQATPHPSTSMESLEIKSQSSAAKYPSMDMSEEALVETSGKTVAEIAEEIFARVPSLFLGTRRWLLLFLYPRSRDSRQI